METLLEEIGGEAKAGSNKMGKCWVARKVKCKTDSLSTAQVRTGGERRDVEHLERKELVTQVKHHSEVTLPRST